MKIERINSEFQKQIAGIIANDFKDPRITGIISVTKVSTASDITFSKIYISVLGANGDEIVKVLNEGKARIRNLLKTRVRVRNIPNLLFELDETIKNASMIDETMKGL
jgi:ribosome-binding factor A